MNTKFFLKKLVFLLLLELLLTFELILFLTFELVVLLILVLVLFDILSFSNSFSASLTKVSNPSYILCTQDPWNAILLLLPGWSPYPGADCRYRNHSAASDLCTEDLPDLHMLICRGTSSLRSDVKYSPAYNHFPASLWFTFIHIADYIRQPVSKQLNLYILNSHTPAPYMSDYIKTAICEQHEKPPGRLWSKWFSFYRLPFYSFYRTVLLTALPWPLFPLSAGQAPPGPFCSVFHQRPDKKIQLWQEHLIYRPAPPHWRDLPEAPGNNRARMRQWQSPKDR